MTTHVSLANTSYHFHVHNFQRHPEAQRWSNFKGNNAYFLQRLKTLEKLHDVRTYLFLVLFC